MLSSSCSQDLGYFFAPALRHSFAPNRAHNSQLQFCCHTHPSCQFGQNFIALLCAMPPPKLPVVNNRLPVGLVLLRVTVIHQPMMVKDSWDHLGCWCSSFVSTSKLHAEGGSVPWVVLTPQSLQVWVPETGERPPQILANQQIPWSEEFCLLILSSWLL